MAWASMDLSLAAGLLAACGDMSDWSAPAVASDEHWDTKHLEQRGELLYEDGRARSDDLHERTLQLAEEGWELVALSPTQRHFRRPKRVSAPVEAPRLSARQLERRSTAGRED